jgi:hypothetical protein
LESFLDRYLGLFGRAENQVDCCNLRLGECLMAHHTGNEYPFTGEAVRGRGKVVL